MASAFSTMKVESTALSGLPAPFLDAMRKLFDIMDCDKVGWIHIDGKTHHSCLRRGEKIVVQGCEQCLSDPA